MSSFTAGLRGTPAPVYDSLRSDEAWEATTAFHVCYCLGSFFWKFLIRYDLVDQGPVPQSPIKLIPD